MAIQPPDPVLVPNNSNYHPGLQTIINNVNDFLNAGTRQILRVQPYSFQGGLGGTPLETYSVKKHYIAFILKMYQSAGPVLGPFVRFRDLNDVIGLLVYQTFQYWDGVALANKFTGVVLDVGFMDFSRFDSSQYTYAYFQGVEITLV